MDQDRENFWLKSRTIRINRRRLLQGSAAFGVGAASLSTVGCGDDDDGGSSSGDDDGPLQTPTPAPTRTIDQVDTNAELKVGFGSFPSTLDAMTAAGQGGQAASNVYHYDTLFGYTAGRQITAGLAEFEFRESNRIFRIKARPGVEFHNGEVLNADTMKFYFERTLGRAAYNPNFAAVNKARASWMGDITVVDPMTIDIAMATPFVDAAEQSGGVNFSLAPKQYIIDKGDSNFAQNPVSVGPMKFVSWTPDQEIRSERNDKYAFDTKGFNGKQASWSKTLVARLIPEEQARLAALEAGEIDIAYRVGPDLAKSFRGREGFKVFILPDARDADRAADQLGERPEDWQAEPVARQARSTGCQPCN
ncbi:hypothetical protein AYO38_12075 [bacterium SCGC AG-212-C10]|nr:hypothetical protein AYO38_12075 [bacterium SCGC AG-212-C10]